MIDKYYIGIDPGKKGAIAIIDQDMKLINSYEMPLTASKEIDSKEIFNILGSYSIIHTTKIILEHAQSMPSQGVKSMFNYGRGYGKLQAVIECLEIPYIEIKSQKWKKEFNLIKKDKKDSVLVAHKLFPKEVFQTPRGRLLDGKAESILMAEWGRRNNI